MPDDALRLEETRIWFTHVKRDLRSAAALLRVKPPLPGHVLFFCQQAVEKTFKGFLTWHDQVARKTHNLTELGDRCAAVDGSLAMLTLRVDYLTKFAVASRYPGEGSEPTASEARQALKLARAAIRTILDRLPRAVRPRGIRL